MRATLDLAAPALVRCVGSGSVRADFTADLPAIRMAIALLQVNLADALVLKLSC